MYIKSIIRLASYCELLRVISSTDFHRYNYLLDYHRFLFGTEIHGFIFNKDTAWLRIDISTALRDYGLLRKFTA